jgi:Flp pilus assembly pilin Flp
MSTRPHARRDERGTTAMEVAGIAPLVALICLVLVQAAFAAYGITAAQTAARQGARAASLGQDPTSAVENALPSWLPATVEEFGPGNGVRAKVDLPDIVPGTDLVVTREAVMP